MYDAKVDALNVMVRAGKIDWAEWARQVKELRETPAAAKLDEMAEVRAAAADARAARDRAEAKQERANDGWER
jgi:hypothetical protein